MGKLTQESSCFLQHIQEQVLVLSWSSPIRENNDHESAFHWVMCLHCAGKAKAICDGCNAPAATGEQSPVRIQAAALAAPRCTSNSGGCSLTL